MILVYDTTCSESLDQVTDWFKLLSETVDPQTLVIALVGNKCDDIAGQ